MSGNMSDDEKKNKVSRRNFLIGAAAGAVIGAVVVGGVAELTVLSKPSSSTKTVTVTSTVSTTVTGTGTTAATGPVTSKIVTLSINNNSYTLEVQSNWTLLEVIRNSLHLFGTKDGCERGECGACTVIVDGNAINSCQMLAVESQGHAITTIEGLGDYGSTLTPLQTAWIANEATQCGYCAPGMILSATALLNAVPSPTQAQILDAMAGHICFCSNYKKIVTAISSVGGGGS
jgi:aerobic-type carbon monoxide dehydrogenase small subunit (CoxS/CutS family)